MNICFTSTFEGTFEDYNNMMEEIRAKFPGITDRASESAELPYDTVSYTHLRAHET